MLRSWLLLALTIVAVGGGIGASSGLGGARAGGAAAGGGKPVDSGPEQPSSREQLAVSTSLSKRGVVFYGAWWCPACQAQKRLFGKQAAALLPYVECDKTEDERKRCLAAQVRVFPTWEFNGRRLEGVQSVETLKRWSGS